MKIHIHEETPEENPVCCEVKALKMMKLFSYAYRKNIFHLYYLYHVDFATSIKLQITTTEKTAQNENNKHKTNRN